MNFVLRKIKNTGSTDPFNARILFGMFRLRDSMVKNEEERLAFDKKYLPITENLEEARDAKDNVIKVINEHLEKIGDGSGVSVENGTIKIEEPIDSIINKAVKDFMIKAEISVSGLLSLCKHLEVDIGFFAKDNSTFSKKSSKFLEGKGEWAQNLVDMLKDDRATWYSKLNSARNQFEHRGLRLPNVEYSIDARGNVNAHIPTIEDMKIQDFLNLMWDNLFEFIEDALVFTIDSRLDSPWIIVKIPENKRDPSMPVKYVAGISTNNGLIFPGSKIKK